MLDSLPKVQSLSLENFTAFEKATFDFCPGINVLIGANATGKSHVLKMNYVLLKACETLHQPENTYGNRVEGTIENKLGSVFYNKDNLVRFSSFNTRTEDYLTAEVRFNYKNTSLELYVVSGFNPDEQLTGGFVTLNKIEPLESLPYPPSSIYLPAQEFLSINEGFIAAYSKRELPYDETYYDLSIALNALPLRKDKLAEMQDAITFLRKIIAGEQAGENEVVTQENGRFKFSLPEGELDVHRVAEGYRKIATLYYLLRNGSLTKDSILFWDEPEANLNPKLVVEVARVLQMLAKAGMQIFITTHDYLLSHELSLLAEYPAEAGVDIRFFALHKPDRKAGVVVETGETLAEIEHNPILEEFAAHYDRESALFYQSEPVGEPGQ